jgi:glutamyl-tRNA synthetase
LSGATASGGEAAGTLDPVTPSPRVRFAPAPTGYLHVGGARSALFNWLFARRQGGTLVLRIEDTDQERSRPELIEAILESLTWLGIDWDEGPIFQSDRRDLYRTACEKLLADGGAYLIDDDKNEMPGSTLQPGLGVAVRVPEGTASIRDLIRGEVTFDYADIEDFVIWRGRNDTPGFLLANAVDDPDLGITHVVRGEDLLSSTPRVMLIRRLLGMDYDPLYAHLPLLVNEQRQKLSKRKDDVSVGDYPAKGYLPEAMANYLALLGWGPPDGVEVRPMAEIVERFRLEDVVSSPAFFDLKKLEHINGEWIRRLSTDEFLAAAEPWVTGDDIPWPADRFDESVWRAVAPLVQERLKLMADLPAQVDWLFLAEAPEDPESWEKAMAGKVPAADLLDAVIEAYDAADWEAETLKETLRVLGEERFELKLGKAQAPVRVAVTGRTVGPPLFEGLVLLGRDETLRRLRAARARL